MRYGTRAQARAQRSDLGSIRTTGWRRSIYAFGLQPVHGFMPMLKIRTSAAPIPLKAAPKPLVLDKIKSTDPLDQQPRDLAFLLDTRLYADGLIVIRNGQVVQRTILAWSFARATALAAWSHPAVSFNDGSNGRRSGKTDA